MYYVYPITSVNNPKEDTSYSNNYSKHSSSSVEWSMSCSSVYNDGLPIKSFTYVESSINPHAKWRPNMSTNSSK